MWTVLHGRFYEHINLLSEWVLNLCALTQGLWALTSAFEVLCKPMSQTVPATEHLSVQCHGFALMDHTLLLSTWQNKLHWLILRTVACLNSLLPIWHLQSRLAVSFLLRLVASCAAVFQYSFPPARTVLPPHAWQFRCLRPCFKLGLCLSASHCLFCFAGTGSASSPYFTVWWSLQVLWGSPRRP